jgi:hypothetical protein
MSHNPLVDFLATYGPTAASQSMYDEHVLQGAEDCRVEPISVESDRLDRIVAALSAPDPRSVILTGTAGDGKTWHCRKVYMRLGGTEKEWRESGCRVERRLASSRRLIIIKDLSQFSDTEEQDRIIASLFEAICRDGFDVYLVAANDGQMLRTLRRFTDTNESGRIVEEAIRTMLKNDTSSTDGLRLDMWNLSRQSHDETFERLLDAVVEHKGWGGCDGCGVVDSCPIRRNRSMLQRRGTVGLRARLREIIRIAADNDMHLPIRQVLLVIVNTLLGVQGRKSPLMICADAESLVREQAFAASNPYDNVVGINLDSNARTYRAFGVIAGFGIGRETNNYIDGLLIDAEPAAEHKRYVADDAQLGAGLFEEVRRQYRRGEAIDYENVREAMERQRRRLFFNLSPTEHPAQNELDPWRLTVFMHAGEYLSFTSDLRKGIKDAKVRNRLVVGLNRTYTGMMCDEGSNAWFAAPAANAQSRIGQVLDIMMPVGENKMFRVHFDFDAGGPHGSARMVVREGTEIVEANGLQPLLFEYLLRVEGGSLPGSFSRQCYEELRQFRLRVVASLAKRRLVDADGVNGISIISLSPDGRLQSDEIGLIIERIP